MRVHAIAVGQMDGNLHMLRAERWSAALRRPASYRFPVHAFAVEHPEGLLLIDTGPAGGVRVPAAMRRIAPVPVVGPDQEIGPALRARGLHPGDVSRVILTHLDYDHVGGIGHVPGAEALVHRAEWEFAHSRGGRMRVRPQHWPEGFAPTRYELDDGPYGPFPASRVLTDRGDVRVVPLPGHTPGQVGVVVEDGDATLFLCADHVLREDWFAEDLAAGRDLGLGIYGPRDARRTTAWIADFMRSRPVVLLPSHDDGVAARLASRG